MKIHYKGKFNGDPDIFPKVQHPPETNLFESFGDGKDFRLGILGSILLMGILFLVSLIVRSHWISELIALFVNSHNFLQASFVIYLFLSSLLYIFIQASFYKQEVYIYRTKALNFLTLPTGSLSKTRFILSLIVPTVTVSLIPIILGLFIPKLVLLIPVGIVSSSLGGIDILAVFKAGKNIPDGAEIYHSGFDIYWYMP